MGGERLAFSKNRGEIFTLIENRSLIGTHDRVFKQKWRKSKRLEPTLVREENEKNHLLPPNTSSFCQHSTNA